MLFYLRKALARFRSSSYKLGIEVGRHHTTNRADRICTFCYNHSNSMHVENGFHVFFICPKFGALCLLLGTGKVMVDHIFSVYL